MPPRRRTFAATWALLIATVLVLAGCSSTPDPVKRTWVPQPSFNGDGNGTPNVPGEQAPGAGGGSGGGGGGGSGSSGSSKPSSPVVARHLTTPTGIAILPDNTALVGERTTGRIVRVQPVPDKPVTTVRTLTGLSTAGGGGLLDLALSPSYSEDHLIYAYITTPTDNRVVDFTLTGPVTPVLTGIPRGNSDNTGRIAFGQDGDLYVGTGDAGTPALAASPTSLAGKVLRVSDIGQPAAGNPTPGSPVYTSGHHVVNGLCAAGRTMLEVETGGARRTARVNALVPGQSYGWPPSSKAGARAPLATLPAADTAPGGCAVLGSLVFVTTRDGQALLSAQLPTGLGGGGGGPGTAKPGVFGASLTKKFGRLLTVVAATDGALWITTSNRDGKGRPVPSDERVLRIQPSGGGGGTNPV